MIYNEPSFESLNASALRFHFSAWELLFAVIIDFRDFHANTDDQSEVTWNLEWQEYLEKATHELEAIYTYLAQANELALKARICKVSPFLLLINSKNRLKSKEGKIDFTELRTIDAIDLPPAVNAICDGPLSENFVTIYHQIRSTRNKISHLGNSDHGFDGEHIIALLCVQYTELWGGEKWLPNWISYSERKRSSHFTDYKNFTEYTDVMYLVPDIIEYLSKSQFKSLFGFPKNKRRYICYICCYNACIERHGVDLALYKTASLKSENELYCAMCNKEYTVERKKCSKESCEGNVIFADDDYTPVCCTCGFAHIE